MITDGAELAWSTITLNSNTFPSSMETVFFRVKAKCHLKQIHQFLREFINKMLNCVHDTLVL